MISVKVALINRLVIFSVLNLDQKSLLKDQRILRIIHFLNDSPPHPLLNDPLLNLLEHFIHIIFNLEWVLIFQQNFQ
jgi:hypothetical protein